MAVALVTYPWLKRLESQHQGVRGRTLADDMLIETVAATPEDGEAVAGRHQDALQFTADFIEHLGAR
eukprot:2308817-Alexandrium_andersonii.AAC.1